MSPRLSDALLRAQSDERLVALARQGRERAFSVLVERHRASLLAFARNVAGDGRGEDVVQQALLQAWTSLANGAQIGHVRGWLFQIVRHAAWRSAARTADGGELPEGLPGAADTEDAVARRLEVDELLVQVAALPHRQRAALVQTALEGRSRREVAEALGLTEGAVRQLLHRARTALRAAATAVTPMPFVEWAARGGTPELVAAGGGAGVTGAILKAGAVVVATGAVAGGVAERHHAHHAAEAKGRPAGPAVVVERAALAPRARPVAARRLAAARPLAAAPAPSRRSGVTGSSGHDGGGRRSFGGTGEDRGRSRSEPRDGGTSRTREGGDDRPTSTEPGRTEPVSDGTRDGGERSAPSGSDDAVEAASRTQTTPTTSTSGPGPSGSTTEPSDDSTPGSGEPDPR